jgi:peptidoglycan/xylan/chitin deacetylase (PgdA/CDA1 family)
MTTVLWILACASLAPLIVGFFALLVFGRRRGRRGPVGILLHSITDRHALHCSYYPPSRFECLIARLSGEGFSFATVSRIASLPQTQKARSIAMTFDDGFANFFSDALPICEHHGAVVTVFCVAGFLGKSSSWDALPKQSHLTSGQIREISALGHEIGSHTLTHANLTLLSDKDLATELCESRKILEDITGTPVTSLSFPFGRVNRRVWEAAKRAGFTAATSYICRGTPSGEIMPLWGAYSYDSVQDVIDRAVRQPAVSNSVARGRLMPHFAKGSPLWKFRDSYSLIR